MYINAVQSRDRALSWSTIVPQLFLPNNEASLDNEVAGMSNELRKVITRAAIKMLNGSKDFAFGASTLLQDVTNHRIAVSNKYHA